MHENLWKKINIFPETSSKSKQFETNSVTDDVVCDRCLESYNCVDKPKNKSTTADHSIIPIQQPNASLKPCEDYQERNEKGDCVDIDACGKKSVAEVCGLNANCISMLGRPRCDCHDGYIKNPITGFCEDKDECENGESNCLDASSTCRNLVGSYECVCLPGFKKLENDTQCVNINGCKDPDLYLYRRCSGSDLFEWQCYDGKTLQNAGQTCFEQQENKCGSASFCDGICELKNGHYTCEKCPIGPFKLDKDKRKCFSTDACYQFPCGECESGFFKNSTTGLCENENYCSENNDICPKDRMVCQNSIGSSQCVCKPGFVWFEERNRCFDVNECIYPDLNTCKQGCGNDWGSYSCFCLPGYVMEEDGKTCVNERPCYEKVFCDGIWEKTDEGECHCKRCPNGLIFSFRKKPYSYFEGNKTEKCFPINKCKGGHTCPTGETCIELDDDDSTVQCVNLNCPEGYGVRNEDGACTKNEGVNDDRALAFSKRLLLLPISYVEGLELRTIYYFNRTDCPTGDEVAFKIVNKTPKLMKKYGVKKRNFMLAHQSASHDLLLANIAVEREQEFIVEMSIACNRTKLHTYELHVFVISRTDEEPSES